MNKFTLSLVLAFASLAASSQTKAQIYSYLGPIQICTGTCASYASLSVGAYLDGEIYIATAPDTAWDATNISDIEMYLFNPAVVPVAFDGTNVTTANPLPITPGTVTVATSGGGATTGGSADIAGTLSGTILLQFTLPPLSTNDTWIIFKVQADGSTTMQVCLFYSAAGCVPGATEAAKAQGSIVFLEEMSTSVAPATVNFGPVVVGSSLQANLTITNDSLFQSTFGPIFGLAAPFRFRLDTCSPQPVMPGGSCSYVSAFEPTVVGQFSDTFFVASVHEILGTNVSVSGEGLLISDTDGDGIKDDVDNCTLHANLSQLDTNEDRIGNACDADINNDCLVNFADLAALKSGFFPINDPDADFTGDGLVNFGDLAFMKSNFFNSSSPGPGPSAEPCTAANHQSRMPSS